MAHPFHSDPRFAFRTPTLPFDVLSSWSKDLRAPGATWGELEAALQADREGLRQHLRESVLRPEVRDALFLASPDLDELIDPWLQGALADDKRSRLEQSLIRYLSRMASRPTPFGLFAACSTGSWGEDTHLRVEGLAQCARRTRLDMDYLCALVEALEKDPAVRRTLTYRPNSSLYKAAGRLRYAEARLGAERGRNYHLVALECPDYLAAVLKLAADGTSMAALAHSLMLEEEVDEQDAGAFIHELIDSQVLVSNLYPAVTGQEPIHGVIAQLASQEETRRLGEKLASIRDALLSIDEAGLGHSPKAYRALAKDLESLPVKINLKHLFQVDLNRPAPEARLSSRVRKDLDDGIALLHRLGSRTSDPMKAFRSAFHERYEARWVPLLEALDEETGIGFESSGSVAMEATPLLEGLPFPATGEPDYPRFTPRDAFLSKRLLALGKALEWELTDEDLKALENPAPPALPDAFAAMATLVAASAEAVDAGDYQFILGNYSGPSGARLLGRFCHGDPQLEAQVKAHLEAEAKFRPEAIYAEVVHLPEGRMGNVLCRPLLRDHEIPFLGAGGAQPSCQIPMQDLLVSVVGSRVALRSRQLGCEVIPRLTSAHSYSRGLSVYRFLGRLQDQDGSFAGWDWGCLSDLPYLPRVRRGRHILAKARWNIEGKEIKAILDTTGSEAYLRFQSFRTSRNLPRFVVLADGDNELLADLDHAPWVETLLRLVAKRPGFQLQEFYPSPQELLAESPEGRHTHELVISYTRSPEPQPLRSRNPEAAWAKLVPDADAPVRHFAPGSEWLYLKLYAGSSTADQILIQGLVPLLEETRGLWDRWFFLRYGDPGNHLRLRFHGNPKGLMEELLPRAHAMLAPLMADGWCWKLQSDTYEPELERYGGVEGLQLAEDFFWHDSELVLGLVQTYPGDAGGAHRWRLGLKAMDGLLSGLGFDLPARLDIVRKARIAFAQEFQSKRGLDVKLGERFRQWRKEMDAWLFAEAEPLDDLRPGLALLNRFNQSTSECFQRLRQKETEGRLTQPLEALVRSYIHMHLNRLFRSSQRAQEFVLYDFLERLYESRLARSANNRPDVLSA
ncbi:lantibiotic dehydratase [Geothrix sp. PMB-07]|uniref:lantibiotic dehydratase n=1 Tax=Geothrix sp. PMB-07 TaxID=3068640 RepID=UPI002742276F|nr:lantibiotic dehydratase [Geothrix sp. PMB-07]WLT33478.1 lantibiotic dehydratase [Geothrix sp. PMB-07]